MKGYTFRPWRKKYKLQKEDINAVETGYAEHLLALRGIEDAFSAQAFIDPAYSDLSSAYCLLNMEAAITRIKETIDSNGKILIFGDYDVDGICSTVLMRQAFRCIGVEADYYIPSRMLEGYGMNAAALETIEKQGYSLIITVDNGIASYELIEAYPKLDFIITDHHQIPRVLPKVITINPKLDLDEAAPFYNLCGCGVAFMLARAIINNFFEGEKEEVEYKLLDLAALATVADVVSLTEDNRILVKYGLEQIKKGERCGLSSLINIILGKEKIIKSADLAFQIAPRINACGRLDHVDWAIRLLETNDIEEALFLSEEINRLNQERKDQERKIYEEALLQIQEEDDFPNIIMVKGETWHKGIIGIVASRLSEKFHCPSIVCTRDESREGVLTGSARSIEGINLYQILEDVAPYLLQFGGHTMAAGLSFEGKNFEIIKDALDAKALDKKAEVEEAKILYYDIALTLENVNFSTYNDLARLEPFGCDNPDPIFLLEDVLIEEVNYLGKQKEHLSVKIKGKDGKKVKGIAFFIDKNKKVLTSKRYNILARFITNSFNGKVSLELNILDIQPFWVGENAEISSLIGDLDFSFPHCILNNRKNKVTAKKVYVAETLDNLWRFIAETNPGSLQDRNFVTGNDRWQECEAKYQNFIKNTQDDLYTTQSVFENAMACDQHLIKDFEKIDTLSQKRADHTKAIKLRKVNLKKDFLIPGKRSIYYTSSPQKMLTLTTYLRSLLHREQRDRVISLNPGILCSDKEKLLAHFYGQDDTSMVISNFSPWRLGDLEADSLIFLDPPRSRYIYDSLCQKINVKGEYHLFDEKDWAQEKNKLQERYPTKDSLSKLYKVLYRRQGTCLDQKQVIMLYKKTYNENISPKMLKSAVKIFTDLALINKIKCKENGYIVEMILDQGKKELSDSILYREGIRTLEEFNACYDYVTELNKEKG